MENTKLERRVVHEMRAVEDSREIVGTAIVFNSPSVDMGFTEIIDHEAVNSDLINTSDIVMLYNHDENSVPLARSKNGKGTLKINITDDGVDFRFKAKDTPLGNEVLEAVKNGDLENCSFAFAIDEDGERWEKLPNGEYRRTVTKIGLLRDFSIVPFPAFPATVVNTRGLDELKAKEELEKRLDEEKIVVVEPQVIETNNELDEYYTQYEAIIDKLKN
jgi:hypothetical protein